MDHQTDCFRPIAFGHSEKLVQNYPRSSGSNVTLDALKLEDFRNICINMYVITSAWKYIASLDFTSLEFIFDNFSDHAYSCMYLCLDTLAKSQLGGAHASCKESDVSSGYEDVLRLAVSASRLLHEGR